MTGGGMSDSVSRMYAQIGSNASNPPIHLWNPPLSGNIDIRIDVNGDWFHESSKITRDKLVFLFASVLRFEPEHGYVLVTPVEKWVIQVDDAPFLAVAMTVRDNKGVEEIWFASNIGEEICVSEDTPLINEGDADHPRPYIHLSRGLKARLTQSVYYQLADIVKRDDAGFYILSCGKRFLLA
jgi:hypothetical protein